MAGLHVKNEAFHFVHSPRREVSVVTQADLLEFFAGLSLWNVTTAWSAGSGSDETSILKALVSARTFTSPYNPPSCGVEGFVGVASV